MGRKEIHITYNTNKGHWQAKKSNGQRASATASTKAEILKIGTQIAKNSKSELIIHNKDAKISNPNSFGNDPCPPRDRKH